ncbi:MAG: hypothetical protein WCG27_08470 [Pseudomonadota bacterium]
MADGKYYSRLRHGINNSCGGIKTGIEIILSDYQNEKRNKKILNEMIKKADVIREQYRNIIEMMEKQGQSF